jgi:hypothetical protein
LGEAAVQVRIQVEADDGRPDVLDLYRWMSEDPDVVPATDIALVGEDSPGALGALEVIDAIVSDVTALGTLLMTIATWRDARARDAVTRIERNGVSLRIESTDPQEIQRLMEQLAQAVEPADSVRPTRTGPADEDEDEDEAGPSATAR